LIQKSGISVITKQWNQINKKEFLLPEEPFISEMKLLIEQSRQKVVVAVNATLSAAIAEPVKDFPLIHYLKLSEQ
jgi:hypothetical protein